MKTLIKAIAITFFIISFPVLPVLGDVHYPDPYWQSDAPEAHGFAPLALENLKAYAVSIESDSLLIVKDGYILLEEYWDGGDQFTQRQVWSVTKSITALIAGIASDRGQLSVSEQTSNYIPEWLGTDSETVTIEHLLRNISGRYATCQSDTFPLSYLVTGREFPSRRNLTQYAIDLPWLGWTAQPQEYEPGTIWGYSNMAIQCLDRVISTSTGTPTKDFAGQNLLAPLEMSATTIGTDKKGQMVMAAGIRSSARDLARIGYLVLNNGKWKGQQIISEEYIANMISPGNNPLNRAYGYLWWLNTNDGEEWNSPNVEPDRQCVYGISQYDRRYPDAPLDVYVASGKNGQYIIVSPSDNMVIIRQGHAEGGHALINDLYKETAAAFMN